MISAQSPTELEVTVDPTKTRFMSIRSSDQVLVTMLGVDPGDGFKPFSPFIAKVNGIEQSLPFTLPSGSNTLELLGEPFDGTGLFIGGYGIHAISGVSIGGAEAEMAAKVAGLPTTTKAARDPVNADLTGLVGTQWFNTITGFWYKEIPGAWQQQS